jgi:hypothetical protein
MSSTELTRFFASDTVLRAGHLGNEKYSLARVTGIAANQAETDYSSMGGTNFVNRGVPVMAKPIAGQVLSVVDLEREIEAQIRNSPPIRDQRPFAPPMLRAPTMAMPDYVEHREGATEIGKLSAEAVVREYEAAAKEIEGMGAELIERVKQCEAMTRDALAVNEEMKETAARYREEAKRIFLQIENCTLMTSEVRKTCTELKERIAAPATASE